MDNLVYFPAGTVVSAPLSSQFCVTSIDVKCTYSVEILFSHLRNTIDFTAHVHEIRDGDFEWFGGPHEREIIL